MFGYFIHFKFILLFFTLTIIFPPFLFLMIKSAKGLTINLLIKCFTSLAPLWLKTALSAIKFITAGLIFTRCFTDGFVRIFSISSLAICLISWRPRGLKTTISSRRDKSSGIKWRRNDFKLASLISSNFSTSVFEAAMKPNFFASRLNSLEPRFEVKITIAFLKLARRPRLSVKLPSSKILNKI